jgi:choline dehydrogenase-like flavoprotein
MRLDFDTAAAPDRPEADVCVVGAGAAGIALALELEDSGLSVLLLESGGTAPDPALADLDGCEIDGLAFPGARAGRARVFGGATTLWAGQALPLDPIDFERRPWVPHSGWPIPHGEVARHYARAERYLGLTGQLYNGAGWTHLGLVPPALDPGLLWPQMSWLAKRRDFNAAFRRRVEASRTIRLLVRATAAAIREPAGPGDPYRVEILSPRGRRGTVAARFVVVACGGIESARLLLASDRPDRPSLGNERDLVGRFLMDHPTARCAEILSPDFDRLAHLFRPVYRRRGRLFPKVALAPPAQMAREVLNATAELVFVPPDGSVFASVRDFYAALREGRGDAILPQGRAMLRHAPDLARIAFHRLVRRRLPAARGSRIFVWAHVEQAPDPESRITLSDARDALGQRRARIGWRLGERDRRTFEVFAETVGAEFRRLGLGTAMPAPWLREAGWRAEVADFYHHIGTLRMADDPRDGVVDRDLRVFGQRGLYVASSAVFPTGGASNPTLTILALAIRLADRLKRLAAATPDAILRPAPADPSPARAGGEGAFAETILRSLSHGGG